MPWYRMGGSSYTQTVNTYTATHTLALVDANATVIMDAASSASVIIPDNTTVPFPIGTFVNVVRLGLGVVQVAGGAGVSAVTESSATYLNGRYSMAVLQKIAQDTWIVAGNLTVPPPAFSYITQAIINSYPDRAAVYTFSGVNFGDAQDNKRILVFAASDGIQGGPITHLVSATIGGVAATIHASQGDINWGASMAVLSASVPTLVSGDIVLTYSSASTPGAAIGVYKLISPNATPADAQVAITAADALATLTTTALDGDSIAAMGLYYSNRTLTLTGGTVDFSQVTTLNTSNYQRLSSVVSASAGTVTAVTSGTNIGAVGLCRWN